MAKDSIETYQKIAFLKEGKCISVKYVNGGEKLKFECKDKHIFSSIANNVKRGSWCPQCARVSTNKALDKRKPTIDDIIKLASLRGGKLLSKNYHNRNTPMTWECNIGHTFKAPYGNIVGTQNRLGTWFPHCHEPLGEKLLREFFKYLFKLPFEKERPDWLTYKGKQLELDGFNNKLRIGFEHHGVFHYKETGFFESKMTFKRRKEFDKAKISLCLTNNVKLVIIPQINTLLSITALPEYLRAEFKRLKIQMEVPDLIPKDVLNSSYKETSFLLKYKDHLQTKKLRIDNSLWMGFHHYYDHHCLKCDLPFKAKASNIFIVGSDCPNCTPGGRKTIAYLQRIAKESDGKLLTAEYQGMSHEYLWRCKNQHEFLMTGKNAKDRWCKACRPDIKYKSGVTRKYKNQYYSIEDVKEYVQNKHSGRCKSNEYINARTKLLFTCSQNHEWAQTFDLILSGKWCPYCAGNAKGTIEGMQEIAKSRKGKCLSSTYINSLTKLSWQCEKSHIWEASPSNIKAGSWCRICANAKRSNNQHA